MLIEMYFFHNKTNSNEGNQEGGGGGVYSRGEGAYNRIYFLVYW